MKRSEEHPSKILNIKIPRNRFRALDEVLEQFVYNNSIFPSVPSYEYAPQQKSKLKVIDKRNILIRASIDTFITCLAYSDVIRINGRTDLFRKLGARLRLPEVDPDEYKAPHPYQSPLTLRQWFSIVYVQHFLNGFRTCNDPISYHDIFCVAIDIGMIAIRKIADHRLLSLITDESDLRGMMLNVLGIKYAISTWGLLALLSKKHKAAEESDFSDT